MTSNAEVLDKGIACLLEGLGSVDTERFISYLVRERFDYTEWQRRRFDGVVAEDFYDAAVEYNKTRPFGGRAPATS